ncbi:MAG TPA: FG-GAP-like repeat-containing protein, partial [Chitinophagales bacterium]|nr:FG-GAP-like repeat-containing protein [Chitinophagales bacterium]
DVQSASYYDNKIAWYENNGSGNFGTQQIITTNAVNANSVYAADLDNDGDIDVLSASEWNNKIAWYENDGSGNFGTQQIITTAAHYARSVYAADLDNDGDIDVLSASELDNKIAWYENDGSGNFGTQQIITTAADGAYSVYATDLDNDGDIDVLSASANDNKIAWYENDGNGNFATQQIITIDASYASSVYAADLDNDGDIDVLSASQGDNKIAWYENDGNGNFGEQQIITTNASFASSVYTADLDNDGDMDVLSASEGDNKIAWYENLLGFNAQASVNSPPCIGANNGSIWVKASGGNVVLIPPYTYTWSLEGSSLTGNGTSNEDLFTIDNLGTGTYQIIVGNAVGDVDTTSITLNEVSGSIFEIIDITTTNSSNAFPNGTIQLSIDGGAAPFALVWSGMSGGSYSSSDSVFVIGNLFAGTYNVTITDAEGRTVGHIITLLDETTPSSTCNGPLDIVILNDSSGSVDATEYEESKQFFVDFMNALNIGTADTQSRAAIVEWSSSGQQQIRIPMTGDEASLQTYTSYSRAFSDGTNPNDALSFGHDYLAGIARPQAIKVLVLSTDGSSGQVSGSLVALAETYKAQGYIIVTIAFDASFADNGVRDLLTQAASLPLLAPGAPAYSMLTPNLAYNIVNLYVCPSDPGSSNTYYFYRDGAIDITGYTPDGFCPTPQNVTLTYTVTAQQQLSLPAGTPITFYYNNPALFSSTPILTTYIPCAIPAGSSEVLSTTLPITGAANIWAVLNDDGTQQPPIVLPVTNIDEHVYVNNMDNIAVCTEPLPTLSALQYTTTPQPICGNTVIYTVDVCNISNLAASQVSINHQAPAGFTFLSQSVNYNNCATDGTTGAITYNIPAGCCVSITYEYDATNAANGVYNDVDVALSGMGGQIYLSYDGASSSAEDVTIDGTVNCPSTVVTFNKTVNTTEICEESFVSYTFTIANETDVALQNISFSDHLPANVIWAAEPYLVNGMSMGQTGITGSSNADFTIAEVPANSVGSFTLDAYLGDWTDNGTITNTAILSNLPAFVNDNGSTLTATAATVTVNALPQVDAINLVNISDIQTAQLSATAPAGTLISWVSSGDGVFDNANTLQPTYTPGEQDIANGSVHFTVAAVSPFNECGQDIDTVLLLIQATPPPLPIELLYFEANSQPHGNLLRWATTTEINNDHFVLWRSENGIDFKPIAQVAAKNN